MLKGGKFMKNKILKRIKVYIFFVAKVSASIPSQMGLYQPIPPQELKCKKNDCMIQ